MATRALRLVRRHVQIEPEFEGDVLQGIVIGVIGSLLFWGLLIWGVSALVRWL